MVRILRVLGVLAVGLTLLEGRPVAQAAVCYVDNTATCPGTGATGTPYCTIQFAVNAAVAGDNLRVRFGTGAYDEHVFAGSSGTAGSRIVLESDNPSQQPKWYYTGSGSAEGAFEFNNTNYWTLQYLTFDGAGVWTSRFAIWYTGTNHQILHNTFQNWGGTTDTQRSASQPIALHGAQGAGALVQDNVFRNLPRALEILGSTAVINRNEFTNITCQGGSDGNTAVAIHMLGLLDGFDTQNVLITNNTFHDFQATNACTLAGGTAWMAALWADDKVLNNTFTGNHIYNLDPVRAPGHDIIGIFLENESHGWVVANNVMHDIAIGIDHSDHSVAPSGGVLPNLYAHNTIYNVDDCGIRVRSGHATIKNNIISNAAVRQMYVYSNAVTEGLLDINYNLYWDSAGGAKVGLWGGGGVLAFGPWKTACGCDANSVNSDPLFANVGPGDVRLLPGSPALNTGLTLGAVTTDYLGVARPQPPGGAYDLGAYEAVQATPAPVHLLVGP